MASKKNNQNDGMGLEGIVKAGGFAMGIFEELIKNKEEILISLLKVLEGKEAKAKVNLDGVKFKIGNSSVKMEGVVEFTFVPIEDKKK